MELKDKKVLVVGSGKTGISTTRFLLEKGARVTLTDHRKKVDIPREFQEKGVRIETGEHRISTFTTHDLIVVSPGVPLIMRAIIEAQARGIEVISEVELAYRFLTAPLIAVTGTNGKTTTTSLLQHMFTLSGKNTFVGGNIGTPLIESVLGDHRPYDYIIAEISSFQLEGIKRFKPRISVLLNITEDHLDRYPSFAEYINAKGRICQNQDTNDVAVLNFDDSHIQAIGRQTAAQTFYFSTKTPLEAGAYDNGLVHLRRGDGEETTLALDSALLKGAHNRENMLAAASVGLLCGLPDEKIHRALCTFPGLPHRMEFVDEIDGINFFNDSKGTNVGACVKSLESIDQPLILIAGGKDKGGSYLPLKALLRRKAKALILLGEAKKRMHSELSPDVPTLIVSSLDEAIESAFSRAQSGDSVLFSPACSSFDMFKSYEHRGDVFKKLVKGLKHKQSKSSFVLTAMSWM